MATEITAFASGVLRNSCMVTNRLAGTTGSQGFADVTTTNIMHNGYRESRISRPPSLTPAASVIYTLDTPVNNLMMCGAAAPNPCGSRGPAPIRTPAAWQGKFVRPTQLTPGAGTHFAVRSVQATRGGGFDGCRDDFIETATKDREGPRVLRASVRTSSSQSAD